MSNATASTVSIRLNPDDSRLIKDYAKLKGATLSELFRNALISEIEDEFDREAYDRAMAAYEKNPKTYTHKEVGKLLGFV